MSTDTRESEQPTAMPNDLKPENKTIEAPEGHDEEDEEIVDKRINKIYRFVFFYCLLSEKLC